MFGISVFIKYIILLEVSLKVSRMLATQIGINLINKPVFVQFYLSKKTLYFVNNHFKLWDIVIRALTARKSKVV